MENEKLVQISKKLKEYNDFVICGHVNHDGDCISCQVTLTLALQKLGKNVTNLLADTSKLNDNLGFLPTTENFIEASQCKNLPDKYCFIMVDCAQDYRIEKSASRIKSQSAYAIIIDHHDYYEDVKASIYYTNPDSSSCSMLCWKVIKMLDIAIDKDIAEAALTGLISDTSSFRNASSTLESLLLAAEMVEHGASTSNVSNQLFLHNSLASLQLQNSFLNQCIVNTKLHYAIGYLTVKDFEETHATKNDTTMLVDLLKSIDCVNFVCVLRQMKADDFVHGSLRAKDDTDVRSLACLYKGGGHIAAAGFTMVGQTDLDAAVQEIYDKMGLLAQGELLN